MNCLKKYWNGKKKLWQAFWFVHFLPPFIIAFIYGIMNDVEMKMGYLNSSTFDIYQHLAFIYALCVYKLFSLIIIWKCAPNASFKFFEYVARIYSCLGIIGITAVMISHLFQAPISLTH